MRQKLLRHEFVDYIPDTLEFGVLYLALEYGAVMHLCADGCGERISTPLHPAQWSMRFDGETVSLSPSVGSGLRCGSHYWIRDGVVVWARRMTQDQFARGRASDAADARRHYGEDVAVVPNDEVAKPGWFTGLLRCRRGRSS